jgi:hypothetical protein
VYWALTEGGLWFEWWFEELVQAAADRVKAGAAGDGGWQAPWRLLHGLAAIGSPALRTAAMQAAKGCRLRAHAAAVLRSAGPAGAVPGGVGHRRDLGDA